MIMFRSDRVEPFNVQDIGRSVFGALFFGLTFSLKGAVVSTAKLLGPWNLVILILSTVIILYLEIKFIGYWRVPKKEQKNRPFPRFLRHRMTIFLLSGVIISGFLIFGMGVYLQFESFQEILNAMVLLFAPCAIGASISDLVKTY